MNLSSLLGLAKFFFRSPEDKAVIRVATVAQKLFASPDGQEFLAAVTDLAAIALPPAATAALIYPDNPTVAPPYAGQGGKSMYINPT